MRPLPIFDCRLPIENERITTTGNWSAFQIKNQKSAIGNRKTLTLSQGERE
jgi:hypothetical protein